MWPLLGLLLLRFKFQSLITINCLWDGIAQLMCYKYITSKTSVSQQVLVPQFPPGKPPVISIFLRDCSLVSFHAATTTTSTCSLPQPWYPHSQWSNRPTLGQMIDDLQWNLIHFMLAWLINSVQLYISMILNPRHQRQIELKLMHDAGMRREYEKAAKLLQNLMNYKRR